MADSLDVRIKKLEVALELSKAMPVGIGGEDILPNFKKAWDMVNSCCLDGVSADGPPGKTPVTNF